MAIQGERYHLGMAGEFFVTAQLQRFGVTASVTYGNAKSADVVAFSKASGRAVMIEVKTSRVGRWPVGNRVPEESEQPWVFVEMPANPTEPPTFYVMTQCTLHSSLKGQEDASMARYLAKHGVPYGPEKPGVAAIMKNQLQQHKDKWEIILDQIQ